jgi:hypothetical protein
MLVMHFFILVSKHTKYTAPIGVSFAVAAIAIHFS